MKGLRSDTEATLFAGDLHPGVAEWLRYRRAEPMLYPDVRRMPYEMYQAFTYCLEADRAAKESTGELDKLMAMMENKLAVVEAARQGPPASPWIP